MTADTKWPGIEKLADEATVIAAHNWHRPLTEIRERIEAELRRALEPLLEALEQQTCSARCEHADCQKIHARLNPWRKR